MKNVLFILADDMGEWAMGCSGNREVITPNIDALASSGMRFSNFFCASPVCSPARASLLTALMPSVHGVHDWLRAGNLDPAFLTPEQDKNWYGGEETEGIEYLAPYTAYTEILASNGYSCALSGKWHLGNSHTCQKGYEKWNIIARGGCNYYGSDMIEPETGRVYINEGYLTDTITDNALLYLDEFLRGEKPFYLGVHYTAPHTPWNRNQHPADVWDMYENCNFDSVPFRELHEWQSPSCQIGSTDEMRRELLRGYYTAVTAMDRNIGRLVGALRDRGAIDNTLIVFCGDNGMNLGQHGVWGKGNGTLPLNMYDTSLRVPFIVKGGGISAGAVCPVCVSQYDFAQTLCAYLGLKFAPYDNIPRPGKSFASAFSGEFSDFEGEVYACGERCGNFAEYGLVRMIRTERYKYIRRLPYKNMNFWFELNDSQKKICASGGEELYDLENDPDEDINLYGNPAYTEIAGELRGKLDAWFEENSNPMTAGINFEVSGFGQIDKNFFKK